MKLIQAKLRGTGPLIESSWIQLSNHLNQFHFPLPEKGASFLRAMQTLHPPFSCKETNPFAELPHYEKRGTHKKHIHPAKRTIALGVFGATAELVTELGVLDDNLYETDRIEIGRRLDYSCWLNFVEISSSTRWKEIKESVTQLLLPLQHIDAQQYGEAISIINNLKGSDRVVGEIAERFLFFLKDVRNQPENNVLLTETVTLINREAHFQTAREVVLKRLPLLIYFNSQGNIAPTVSGEDQAYADEHQELFRYSKKKGVNISAYKNPSERKNMSVLEKIGSGIRLSRELSSELKRMDPIFLFDAPEVNIPSNEHDKLRELIEATAQSQQCFYLSGSKDFFQPEDTGKNYRSSELELKQD